MSAPWADSGPFGDSHFEGNCRTDSSTMVDAARVWGGNGWRRYLFPAFWLIYLGQTVGGVEKHSHGAAAVVGYVLVGAFALVYLVALQLSWYPVGRERQIFYALYAVAVALTVAESLFAGSDALVFGVYLAVLTVSARGRTAVPVVLVITAAATLLPRFVPGWGHRLAWDNGLTVFLVAFAMYGFFMLIRNNIELTAARTEVARLAAENERSRIARDLHDLLGHSLTTITVKAALAARLADRDPGRAAEEIAAVEQLSRSTLGEVRAAVSGYREVTLAGELASSREVLRAAGIEADFPGAVDAVDADAVEPFGWVVREAVTNVVRHSRAKTCAITVGPRWIEVTDDGRGVGPANAAGHGLTGLGERLAAVGGSVTTQRGQSGFVVRAQLSDVAAPVEGVERVRVDV